MSRSTAAPGSAAAQHPAIPQPPASSTCVAASTTAAVEGVDHVGIAVSDLDRELPFWLEVLGFRLVHNAELSGDFGPTVAGVAGSTVSVAMLSGPDART